MLKITKQQMAELSRASARGFEERMVLRAAEKLSVRVARQSGVDLLGSVKQAIERAASYHITVERDARRFVDLTIDLGEHFDVDPALPWAGELLSKASPRCATDVVDRLCEMAAERLDPRATRPGSLQSGAGARLLDDRARIGDPIERCPRSTHRRFYAFSS